MYTAMFQLRPNCGRIRRTYFRPVARTGVGESMSRMTRFARQPIAKKTARKASWIICSTANGGGSDSECDSRARTLREAARFCRVSLKSRSLRKQRHGSTAARRPLLVPALRKTLRVGRAGAYSRYRLTLGAESVFCAFYQ